MSDPPAHLASALLTGAGLPHCFTTRHFPDVRSPNDREGPFGPGAAAAIGRLGMDPARIAFARQVHGAEVLLAAGGGRIGSADALMTDQRGLPLAVFTADCLPIVIHDPGGEDGPPRLAVIHAGWRGTVRSVARAAVEALARAGGPPRRFVAAIGPSIGPCCYEVDRPVIDRLAQAFPGRWQDWVTVPGPGGGERERWMLDLWRANRDQLVAAGLDPERIDNLRMCTACRLDMFFSYRRGASGRLIALAALPGRPASPC